MFTMTLAIIAAIADAALAHRHSVERRLLGLPVRGRVGQRIDAELAKRGITPGAFLPSTEPPAISRAV
jgi:hypothetical protein